MSYQITITINGNSSNINNSIVVAPSAPLETPLSAPSPTQTAARNTAIQNLRLLPPGLWALILLLTVSLAGGALYFWKRRLGEKPKKTEAIALKKMTAGTVDAPVPVPVSPGAPLPTANGAVVLPRESSTTPPTSPSSLPRTANGAAVLPREPETALLASQKDPAKLASGSTLVRNAFHGGKEGMAILGSSEVIDSLV